MKINVVRLTNLCPRSSVVVRRIRAAITGKPYFFNRQKMRVRVFNAINEKIYFNNYIETGTYLGITTHFLSATAARRSATVYSCEINDDYFAIARRTVGYLPNVHLHRGDSTEFLRHLTSQVSSAVNFVYLDAHWHQYLPLRDELSILCDWRSTVIMIDDFQVPYDNGFRWDKYDDEREICLRYIDGIFEAQSIYCPAYPAYKEGHKVALGYCVIATSKELQKVLNKIELLKSVEASTTRFGDGQKDDMPSAVNEFRFGV